MNLYPYRSQLLTNRLPADAGRRLDAAKRPAQPAERSHLILLFGAQDVCHPRVETMRSTRNQRMRSTSQLADFQAFPTGRI